MMLTQLANTWYLILISIAASVAGQTVIKLGVSRPENSGAGGGILSLITTILTSPLILAGLLLYGVGALAWIAVLSRMDLSYAYPFLALNFILIVVVSRFFLNEAVPPERWIGVMIICVGIIVVARSAR